MEFILDIDVQDIILFVNEFDYAIDRITLNKKIKSILVQETIELKNVYFSDLSF